MTRPVHQEVPSPRLGAWAFTHSAAAANDAPLGEARRAAQTSHTFVQTLTLQHFAIDTLSDER